MSDTRNETLKDKFRYIKLLILDVDGVLTDGKITFTAQGDEIISFHVYDGFGIKQLQKIGVHVAIISGRDTPAVAHRLKQLQVHHVFLGQLNKIPAFEALTKELNVSTHEIAFIGDDLPDLPIMKKVGIAITVPNATDAAKKAAQHCTQLSGGNGAVREICDLIYAAQSA